VTSLRWRSLLLLGGVALAPSFAFAQRTDDGGWKLTDNPLVPRVRLTADILDSQPAVLEVSVESGKDPYRYSVDWGDGGRPETGRRQGGPLRLTHDYDRISTFRIVVKVSAGGRTATVDAGLVTVRDDDVEPPNIEWSLPPPVVRPGERAVVGWRISDASGLQYVVVTVQGPNGPLERMEKPEGTFDITGRGLGIFGFEVRTGDADHDRPGDEAGYMIIEIITVTDDLDRDGILDYLDNCPRHDNREQRDGDNDGLGDPCDPCPDVNGRCPETRPPAPGGPR
jgi:hypothetical protein